MKHLKKFESFEINEELVSAIELQRYEKFTKSINGLIDSSTPSRPNLSPIELSYEFGSDYQDEDDRMADNAKYSVGEILKQWSMSDKEFSYMDENTKNRVKSLFGLKENDSISLALQK